MHQVNGAPLLEVENVSKAYGYVNALIDVSVDVHAGEIVGLVGDNGAGRIIGWMNKKEMRKRARVELDRLQIPIADVDVAVDDLSGGQRQAVAVARSIAWGKRLVMMDEPTANLGVEEQEKVAALVRRLAEDDIAVLLVSHNLAQVMELAQRVVVLRHGRRVAVRSVGETTREEVVALITGAIEGDSPE